MKDRIKTVVLCWRSGGDFHFSDVLLLAEHLHLQADPVNIICFTNTVDKETRLNGLILLPFENPDWKGWWCKMNMFSPEMEKYRPFLYMDLDTAIVGNLQGILPPEGYENKFICLGGFYQPDTTNGLQSGLMWFPEKDEAIKKVWEAWKSHPIATIRTFQNRGGDQAFIRSVLGKSDIFWQAITDKITSFKIGVKGHRILTELPQHISIVCFHGQPRIPLAGMKYDWVNKYIRKTNITKGKCKVTIIIPYKKNPNRPWLQDAINSVPLDCQLIVSEGNGMWACQFNKVLSQVEGKYVKYLHDDDMLTPNCIEDSVRCLEESGADFIHGMAEELVVSSGNQHIYTPPVKNGGKAELLQHNFIHSATTMYRKEIFEKLGGFDESLPDSEEYEFNLRCLNAGFKLKYCDSVLAVYRRHPEQQTVKLGGKQLLNTSKKIADKYR